MSDQSSGSRAVQKTPSTLHDIITGGVEGGVGVLALEPLLQKLKGAAVENPFRKGALGRLGSGAAIGAGATGLIGALVSAASRKTKEKRMNLESLAAEIVDVVELRKLYAIEDDPEGDPAVISLPGSSKAHAALRGGVIGGAIGIGAGTAAAAALPFVAKRAGMTKSVSKFEKALGGKSGAAIKTSLALAGVAGKIGATVGAIQGVASHNEDVARSKAIARALRKARAGKNAENKADLERIEDFVVELDYPESRLKSGYRLDKYQKTIKAREIDRKTGNYVRATVYGGMGGVILPTRGSLKQRALIGAATGAGLAAALHFNSPKDEYGEQSEAAKLVQRRVIQGAGVGALAAGIIARKKQIGGVLSGRDNADWIGRYFRK